MKYSSDLGGEAYISLRERILHGNIAIGEVISRRKIAAEFFELSARLGGIRPA